MNTGRELISSYLDGTISQADLRQLEQWIKEQPDNAREMALMGILHQGLTDHFQSLDMQSESYNTDGEMVDTMIMPALRLPEATAKAQTGPAWVPGTTVSRLHLWNAPDNAILPKPGTFQLRWFAAVAGIALFVFCGISAVIYLAKPNLRPRYAHIEAVVSPRWGVGSEVPYLGESLPSRKLFLRSGLVQLKFNNGVSVVLQGPSRFKISSDHEFDLFSGKVAADVPHAEIGFSIHTSQAVVTDLGTDFGVKIAGGGITNVIVFKGKVAASAIGPNGKLSEHLARIIQAGFAAKASHAGISVVPAAQVRLHFVQTLISAPLKLNLVDMIAGGNGLGCRTGVGINASNGQVGNLVPSGDRPGDGVYHRITSIPILSGCFVPGSSRGPAQIDPIGNRFQFPTSVNNVFGNIWAGGIVPWLNSPPTFPISTILRGTNYATYPNDVLVIHSNAGLTFNLNAIHRIYPRIPIRSFHAILGDSFVGADSYDHIARPKADVFVLADGKLLFKKIGINGEDAPTHVDLKIPLNTHFLTLVTTDGGDGTADDWVLWCNPGIDLQLPTK